MSRIAGVTITPKKQLTIALTDIYGVGRSRAKEVLLSVGVNERACLEDISEEQIHQIRECIEKQFKVEGDLRREVLGNIKRLKEIGSYRGTRHIKHLPLRGQKTKTNTRTVRGNRRQTMGSGRRALTKT
ncbi:30S ribosomal protein S13 [Candidatus Uhrbacteria bacterium CG_4_9_14_3_um_filter_36_7]|uniref:Small ribosomal subunit protein uS13 n=1 Tax=Candidatus Uhrbacteria bacterium CG_4_9_14_3_um_filter_36_7 TaxID=1975033 RepID=A0A2M7XIN5_9BACT|nr:MAG: 30S ribosomal protein S13 [Candidatus Uhrbacteria bacterium CG_4_9_14_3_um_filter_36_7]